MFSGWISRVSSSIVQATSPKAILASYLASSLSEFFQVDTTQIESNLLSDTKIVLKQVQLKPLPLNHASDQSSKVIMMLVGQVEEVVFSWTWGGSADGSTSFIRETMLTIQGAKFRVVERERSVVDTLDVSTNPQVKPSNCQRTTANNESYIQRHVQQIIDHLTLNITDVEVTMECGELTTNPHVSQACVVVEAKSLQLISFGRDTNAQSESSSGTSLPPPPLSQRISLNSLAAYIVTKNKLEGGNDATTAGDAMTRVSLMEPFGYAASVKRVAGRRFMDGIASGLEVIGEIVAAAGHHRGKQTKDTGKLVVHAGTLQVQVLCKLARLFLPTSDSALLPSESSPHEDNSVPTLSDPTLEDSKDDTSIPSTTFFFPLPSVVLWLPNNSMIQLPNCAFQYHMDGTVFNLQGTEGIHINRQHDFLRVHDKTRWVLDVANCKASVEHQTGSDHESGLADRITEEDSLASPIAHIQWDEVEMKKLVCGAREIMTLVSVDLADDIVVPAVGSVSLSSSSPSWTIALDGLISVKVEGPTGWVSASINTVSVTLSPDDDGFPKNITVGEVTVGPTSFGTLSIQLPPLVTVDGSREVVFKGTAEVELQSTSVVESVLNFLSREFDLNAENVNQGDAALVPTLQTDKATRLPFAVCIPAAIVTLLEPSIVIVAKGTKIQDLTLHCESVRLTSKDLDVAASAVGVMATVEPSVKVSISLVESFSVSGVGELAEPIRGLEVRYDGGLFQIDLPLLSVITPVLVNNQQGNKQNHVPVQGRQSPLPFPIQLRVNLLKLKPSKGSNSYLRLNSIKLTATQVEDALSISSSLSIGLQLQASDENWLKASINKFSVLLDHSYAPTEVRCNGLTIGPSSCGDMSIIFPSIATCSGMTGLTISDSVDVSFGSIDVVTRFQNLLSAVSDCVTSPSTSTSKENPMSIPIKVSIPKVRASLIHETIKLEVHNTTIGGSNIECGRISFDSGTVSAALSGTQVLLSPSFSVQLQSIDSFSFQGVAALHEPITDVALVFDKGVLCAKLKSVSLLVSNSQSTSASQASNGGSFDTATLLPWPLQVQMDHVKVKDNNSGLCLQVHPIHLMASQTGTSMAVVNHASTSIRLQASNGEYLDMRVDQPSVCMTLTSEGLHPGNATTGRIHVGPTSCGHLAIDASSFSMDSENIALSVDEALTVSLQSMDVVTKLQNVFVLPFGAKGQAVADASGSVGIPPALSLPLFVPELNVKIMEPSAKIAMKSIRLFESNLHCGSLSVSEGSGIWASVSYLDASLGDCIQVQALRVDTLTIPGTFYLHQPISSPKVVFMDGVLQVAVPSVSVVVTPTSSNAPASKVTNKEQGGALPFPVQVMVQQLDVQMEGHASFSAHLSDIDVIAVPVDKAISIEHASPVTIRLQTLDAEWLEGRVNGISALLSPYDFYPTSVMCAGIEVGPSSMGHVSVKFPPISMNARGDISADGTVAVVLQSTEVLERLQQFATSLVGPSRGDNQTTSIPFTVSIPKVTIEVVQRRARAVLDAICLRESKIICTRAIMKEENSGMSARLFGIGVNIFPHVSGGVEMIESLSIPNTFTLEKPSPNASFDFIDSNSLQVKVYSFHIVMSDVASNDTSDGSISVPFPIHLTLNELNVRAGPSSNESTVLQQIDCLVRPIELAQSQRQQPPGVVFQLTLNKVDNKMMSLQSARVRGMMYSGQVNTIHRLHVVVGSLSLVTGFSIRDWASMVTGERKEKQEPTVLMLPLSCLESLHATMTYKGTLVSTKETHVQVPRFLGGPNTTSKDLMQHITQSIVAHVPSFLVNTKLAGEDVVEMTAKQVGRAAMSTTLTGAMGGSVVGLVATDSVRGLIASGKKSRNASEKEGYRFGDFTRGLFHAASQTTKSGGELRRGDSSREYSVGDFSAGAAQATGTYVVENKSRLAAAGGSGVGMAVGLALAGPAGWIVAGGMGLAGAYAGSKAGASIFDDDKDKLEQKAAATADGGTNSSFVTSQQTALSQSNQQQVTSVATRSMSTTTTTTFVQRGYNNNSQGYHTSQQQVQSGGVAALNVDEDLLGMGQVNNNLSTISTQNPNRRSLISDGTADLLGLGGDISNASSYTGGSNHNHGGIFEETETMPHPLAQSSNPLPGYGPPVALPNNASGGMYPHDPFSSSGGMTLPTSSDWMMTTATTTTTTTTTASRAAQHSYHSGNQQQQPTTTPSYSSPSLMSWQSATTVATSSSSGQAMMMPSYSGQQHQSYHGAPSQNTSQNLSTRKTGTGNS